jgi:hypothetical protein
MVSHLFFCQLALLAIIWLFVMLQLSWPRPLPGSLEVAPNMVLNWLVEAAEQLQAFSHYFLCDTYVEQLQLDGLYAVLRDLKAGVLSKDEGASGCRELTISRLHTFILGQPARQVVNH